MSWYALAAAAVVWIMLLPWAHAQGCGASNCEQGGGGGHCISNNCVCNDPSFFGPDCHSHRCNPGSGALCGGVGSCVHWTNPQPPAPFGYLYCVCDGLTQAFCQAPTCVNTGFEYSPQVVGTTLMTQDVSISIAFANGVRGIPIYGSVCSGLGTCNTSPQTCTCFNGLGGPWCTLLSCFPNDNGGTQCAGHGTPVTTGNNCQCTCDEGWVVPTCNAFDCGVSIGNGLACHGSGTCNGFGTGSGSCTCNLGTSGNICDTNTCTAPSVPVPCSGNGTCSSNKCDCHVDRCGTLCEVNCQCNLAATATSSCTCGGTGVADVYNSSTCHCNPGFGPPYCCPITNGKVCNGHACLPGGICACPGTVEGNECSGFGTCGSYVDANDGICLCDDSIHYTTPNCCPMIPGITGQPVVCGGRGTCTGTGCQCNTGYNGTYCCAGGCTSPSNGICQPDGTCGCINGFSGPLCNINVACPNSCGGTNGMCITEPFEQTLSNDMGVNVQPQGWASYDAVLGYGGYDSTFTIHGVTFVTPYAKLLIDFNKGFVGHDVVSDSNCDFTFWNTFKTYTETPFNPGTFSGITGYTMPVNSTYDLIWQLVASSYHYCTNAPSYVDVIIAQKAAGTLTQWVIDKIQYFNPLAVVVDAAYVANIVQILDIPLNLTVALSDAFGPFVPVYIDIVSRHTYAVLNMWLYSFNVDPTTGGSPGLFSYSPPHHCTCAHPLVNPIVGSTDPRQVHQQSPRSWQPDCSLSGLATGVTGPFVLTQNSFSFSGTVSNPVDCGGYQGGVFWGYYNPAAGSCACGPHRAGADCHIVLPDVCFDPTLEPTGLPCHGNGNCLTTTKGCVCIDSLGAPTKYTGSLCQYSVCSWNATAEVDRITECNGMGTCTPTYNCSAIDTPGAPLDPGVGNGQCIPTGTCVCDVAGQLHNTDGDVNNPPFLPVGANCDVDAIDDCGVSALVSDDGFSTKVSWTSCNNNGVCVLNATDGCSYQCACNANWAGPKCTIATCASVGGCNANQTCDKTTSSCLCKPLYSTPSGCTSQSCACSVQPCGHGQPDASTGSTCICNTNYVKDTSGHCTILQCPLVLTTDSGEVSCYGSQLPTCNSTQKSHRDQCCANTCPFCTSNSTVPFLCHCNPVYLYQSINSQTDGVCHTLCHGQGYQPHTSGGVTTITCQCSTAYFIQVPWNATVDWMDPTTCLRTRCANGEVTNTAGNGCICPLTSCPLPPSSSSAGTIVSSSSAGVSAHSSSSSSSADVSSSSGSTGQRTSSTGVPSSSAGVSSSAAAVASSSSTSVGVSPSSSTGGVSNVSSSSTGVSNVTAVVLLEDQLASGPNPALANPGLVYGVAAAVVGVLAVTFLGAQLCPAVRPPTPGGSGSFVQMT